MIKYYKKNRLLFVLITLTIISIILGIICNTLLSEDNKILVSKNINLLLDNKLIIPKSLIFNNLITTLIIWLLGISIIGIILIFPIYLFKVFIFSFETISLISNLKLKNILLITVYLIPNLINLFIYFIICYYGITYSYYLIKHIFFNKKYNMYKITKKYIIILGISLVLILLSSILEIFII